MKLSNTALTALVGVMCAVGAAVVAYTVAGTALAADPFDQVPGVVSLVQSESSALIEAQVDGTPSRSFAVSDVSVGDSVEVWVDRSTGDVMDVPLGSSPTFSPLLAAAGVGVLVLAAFFAAMGCMWAPAVETARSSNLRSLTAT